MIKNKKIMLMRKSEQRPRTLENFTLQVIKRKIFSESVASDNGD